MQPSITQTVSWMIDGHKKSSLGREPLFIARLAASNLLIGDVTGLAEIS